MDENDKIDPTQLKGFNDGYLIAKYEPELSEQLSKIEAVSPHIVGMQQGRNQFLKEQIREKIPSWLKDDRFDKKEINPSKDKGLEPER